MIEQPQPPEGDEATTGTMSPLAAVRQYLSTNNAKSTFLHNSGLVVKVTSSKSPTRQNLLARQSDIYICAPDTSPIPNGRCFGNKNSG